MPQFDPPDVLLAIRCQLGDEAAWTVLIERWHPRLWRFIANMLSDRAAAEDVLQTVWLRVVRSMGRLQNPEHLSAWLYRIARTAVTDRLRDQYRREPTEPMGECTDIDGAPEQFAIADLIHNCLDRLGAPEREVVVLHYLEELPLVEVAGICGVPLGTIKSRLYRARQTMRRTLTDQGIS